jgi:hypothetical protein
MIAIDSPCRMLLPRRGLARIRAGAAAPAPPPKPTVYALVSAVGGDLTFVRNREQVGSNRVDTYHRLTLKIPDASLDGAGAARHRQGDPRQRARRGAALHAPQPRRAGGRGRAEEGRGRARQAGQGLRRHARAAAVGQDHRHHAQVPVPVARPHASKLSGLGVYVQPLRSATGGGVGSGIEDIAPGGVTADEDTTSPDGEYNRSSTYVAPYFYTQLWILDAKTLTVLDTEERYDYQKIYDWRWTANDVQRNLSPEQMAETVQAFVERSAARATREAVGTVTVGEPKLVNPKKP